MKNILFVPKGTKIEKMATHVKQVMWPNDPLPSYNLPFDQLMEKMTKVPYEDGEDVRRIIDSDYYFTPRYCDNMPFYPYHNGVRYIFFEWPRKIPELHKVIFNGPATIALWKDGTKTVVKCHEQDIFDNEKGLMLAFFKRIKDNDSGYYSEIQNFVKNNFMYFPFINKVIFNDAMTIMLWEDGTKTFAKINPLHAEPSDMEKGVLVCILKKIYGKDFYNEVIRKKINEFYQEKRHRANIAMVDAIKKHLKATNNLSLASSFSKQIFDRLHASLTAVDRNGQCFTEECAKDISLRLQEMVKKEIFTKILENIGDLWKVVDDKKKAIKILLNSLYGSEETKRTSGDERLISYLRNRNRICHETYAKRKHDDEYLCENCILNNYCAPPDNEEDILKSIAIVDEWAAEHMEDTSKNAETCCCKS